MALPTPAVLKSYLTPNPDIPLDTKLPAELASARLSSSDPVTFVRTMQAGIIAFLEQLPPPVKEVQERQLSYVTRDNQTLSLYTYAPSGQTSKRRVLVWFHGGGGCLGHPAMSAVSYRSWVSSQNCVVIAPQYRLGPDHKFPIGLEDCWDALQHIVKHADELGVDPSLGFVLGGESHGSTTAAAMSLLARDQKDFPPITGSFLSAGSYVPPDDVPEKYQPYYLSRYDPVCLAGPGLDERTKAVFDACYVGDYTSPMYKAILWPSGHKGLPKTYFQSCGRDIMRDDSFIYRDVLSTAGVPTKLDIYPGAPHCFWTYMTGISLVDTWKKDTNEALTWLFEKAS